MSAELQSVVQSYEDMGAGAITSMPILILNVHENCNCRCSMCDIWKRPAGAELQVDRVRLYQESIRALDVKQVVLTGGEPLLHSQLRDLCNMLKECRVRITLLSTGLLLKSRAEIVAECVDEVIVSLDGPPEVHDSIRRISRAYQVMQDGIRAVRKISPRLPIHARSTIQQANFGCLRRTVGAAHDLGCDSISFLAVDTTSKAFNREFVWPVSRQNEVGITSRDLVTLDAEVELLIAQHGEEFASRYIAEDPEKLRRIANHFRQQLGLLPLRAPMCNAPWVSAVVEVDGSVRPCFFHDIVGNAGVLPLHEALNTPEARAFRQTLDVESNSICQRCVCSLNYRL